MEERETIRLSDSEWRVMEELWTAPSTLMELVRTLGNKAGWAKSTVATVLRRMEAKGLVTYEEGGKARVYHPALRREDAALAETRSLLHRAYHGSVGLMMSALLLMAESNVKEVAFFCMAALIALVIFSLVCGFVTFNTDLSGGRVRYTLGFSNVNAASVFFMSLVFCYMVAVKPDLLDMIPVAGFIVLLFLITDTRSMIFGGALLVAAYCAFYLLKKKRN